MQKQSLELTDWISVDDRLPDVGTMVLCYRYYNEIYTAYCDTGDFLGVKWVPWGNSKMSQTKPTHWMPLPEPPNY